MKGINVSTNFVNTNCCFCQWKNRQKIAIVIVQIDESER